VAPPRTASLRALYAGVSGPLVMVGLVQSAHFAIYDSTRRVLHRRAVPDGHELDYLHRDSIHNVAISAMTAGSALAFFTSPLILIKTKQQIMMWDFKTAFFETLQPTTGRSGAPSMQWTNFYAGFGPHFFIETVGRGIYFASYETLKRYFQTANRGHHPPPPSSPSSNSSSITIQERCFSAAVAGITSWAIMFPMDALRARLYSQTIHGASSQGPLELFLSIYTQQGIMPFYRGFGVTLLRAGPVSAAILPIYDMTLHWLNRT